MHFFNIHYYIYICKKEDIYIPSSVVILTWLRQERANSQKSICVSSCQKNLHILPLISLSFVLSWSLYSSLALAVFWLFPRPLEDWVKLSCYGVGFTSALVKWNTSTVEGSQTESDHYFIFYFFLEKEKRRDTFWLVKESVRETKWIMAETAASALEGPSASLWKCV